MQNPKARTDSEDLERYFKIAGEDRIGLVGWGFGMGGRGGKGSCLKEIVVTH